MSLHPSKVTRLVDRCEALGLVERVPCPDDRRALWAQLTRQGRAAITAAAPALLDALDRHYFEVLTDREVAQLAKLSRRLRDAAHTNASC
jgi:DNA-binding MarR family transcriptional regulator